MKLINHNTAAIYRQIVAETDMDQKIALFTEQLLGPFEPSFKVFAGMFPGECSLLGIAEMWNFLTPDKLNTLPDALVKLEQHDAWQRASAALENGIEQFAPYADQIPLDVVNAGIFLLDPARVDAFSRGYTGVGNVPGYILALYDTPNDYNLPRLEGLVVHEFHHNVRFSGTTHWRNPQTIRVADYILDEGLAESFAAELYGEDVVGYYVTDFDKMALAEAKTIIGNALQVQGFNEVRAYIFGDALAEQWGFPKRGVPTFAGYAVGYHVVQAYLKRSGKTVAEATFLPAEEIIAESGYFEDVETPAW